MNTYVVWLEMDLARIFKVQMGGPEARIIHRHEIKHHTSRDPENHKNLDRFFGDIVSAIRNADEILLVGRGHAKEHFKTYLSEHRMKGLLDNVVATKTADHLSDAKLLELSRKFFRIYDAFENVI